MPSFICFRVSLVKLSVLGAFGPGAENGTRGFALGRKVEHRDLLSPLEQQHPLSNSARRAQPIAQLPAAASWRLLASIDR